MYRLEDGRMICNLIQEGHVISLEPNEEMQKLPDGCYNMEGNPIPDPPAGEDDEEDGEEWPTRAIGQPSPKLTAQRTATGWTSRGVWWCPQNHAFDLHLRRGHRRALSLLSYGRLERTMNGSNED
jgi:hypothetical protein